VSFTIVLLHIKPEKIREFIMKTLHSLKPKQQTGFTLVELMVALTVGMLILIALSSIMVNNTTSRRTGDRNTTLQTNARFAMEILRQDVQHAGYAGVTGYFPHTVDSTTEFNSLASPAPATITNPCSPRAGDLKWPVEGSDNANTFDCMAGDYLAGTDVLLVRHTAQQSVLVRDQGGAQCSNNLTGVVDTRAEKILYYYSDMKPANSLYGVGTTTPTNAVGDTPNICWVFAVMERIYYIRPWSFSPDDNMPALVRRSLVAGATGPAMGSAELIAPGIADMQISYGISSDRTGTNPGFNYSRWNNDLINVTSDLNVSNSLESVRISMLAQSLTQEPKYINTNTYDVGDKKGVNPPDDGFRREVINTTIQVRR
jgi:type IV pilus assembly protein PilW